MILYERGNPQHDVLILQWWNGMLESGELTTVFGTAARSLGAFYQLLAPPRLAAFEVADDRVLCAFIVDPVLQGAFVSLWIAPDHRHSVAMRRIVLDAYRKALTQFPVLLGVTKQPALRKVHEHWGYEYVGTVPRVFDGEDGMLFAMTVESFTRVHGYGEEHGNGLAGEA